MNEHKELMAIQNSPDLKLPSDEEIGAFLGCSARREKDQRIAALESEVERLTAALKDVVDHIDWWEDVFTGETLEVVKSIVAPNDSDTRSRAELAECIRSELNATSDGAESGEGEAARGDDKRPRNGRGVLTPVVSRRYVKNQTWEVTLECGHKKQIDHWFGRMTEWPKRCYCRECGEGEGGIVK